MRSPLLIVLATSALAFAACSASQEEVPVVTPSPTATPSQTSAPSLSPVSTAAPALTPGPGVTLWRWGDLTILIPEGSGMGAMPGSFGAASPGGTLAAFRIDKKDPNDPAISSYALLDGENGSVLTEEIRPEHRDAIDAVLATVQVRPLDAATAAWPYNGGDAPADVAREEFMGFSILNPSPSTGLYVSGGLADPGGVFVSLTNGRSVAFVNLDAATGQTRNDTSSVAAEDLAVFERWLVTVKRCGTEIEC